MIDIQKIVTTNFNVIKTQAAIGSYKKTLFVYKNESALTSAKSIYAQLGGNVADILPLSHTTSNDESDLAEKIISKKKDVSGTDQDFIFVCLENGLTINLWNSLLPLLVGLSAPYKIIPCVSLESDPGQKDIPVAVKLCNSGEQAAISIPAYFSKINLDRSMSLRDYCYTEEKQVDSLYTIKTVQDTDYESCVSRCNFLNQVGKNYVNFGGNLVNGVSIAAQFGAIAAENDIVRAVLDAMLKKPYLNNAGLNNVISAINTALTRYTHNGFLEQNGVYTGETYEDNYTTPPTTLIKKGVILPEGYYVARIPMSKINMNDRKARKFTPITIFMQTLSGARVVEIDGAVVD